MDSLTHSDILDDDSPSFWAVIWIFLAMTMLGIGLAEYLDPQPKHPVPVVEYCSGDQSKGALNMFHPCSWFDEEKHT